MMKTPKEIKKGLDLCKRAKGDSCDKCPYQIKPLEFDAMCIRTLEADALTYIKQLEAERIKIYMVKAAAEMCIDEDIEAIHIDVGPGFPNECELGKYQMTRADDGGIKIAPVQNDPERHSLRLHNEAISALDALICDGIDDDVAAEQALCLLDRLRQVRMNTFEHLVPWEQLAGGGAQ